MHGFFYYFHVQWLLVLSRGNRVMIPFNDNNVLRSPDIKLNKFLKLSQKQQYAFFIINSLFCMVSPRHSDWIIILIFQLLIRKQNIKFIFLLLSSFVRSHKITRITITHEEFSGKKAWKSIIFRIPSEVNILREIRLCGNKWNRFILTRRVHALIELFFDELVKHERSLVTKDKKSCQTFESEHKLKQPNCFFLHLCLA